MSISTDPRADPAGDTRADPEGDPRVDRTAAIPPAGGAVDLRAVGDRIERLLDDVRASAGPVLIERVEDLLRQVTELYAAGLANVVRVVAAESPPAMAALVADDLVSSLLIVHGLHPDGLPARIEGALEQVRPFLAQHGGDVELLDIDADAGAVLLRLLGSCDGCPSSAVTLQQAVERAIVAAAPEIVIIDVEPPTPVDNGVPIALGHKPTYDECPAPSAGLNAVPL